MIVYDYINAKAYLTWLIKRHCVITGNFKLSSGKESNTYIDLRQLTLSNHVQLISALIETTLLRNKLFPDAIGGPESSSNQIVGALLERYVVNYGFSVLKTPKPHGITNQDIAGKLRPGSDVVLVDDVTTSGKTLVRCANIVEKAGCVVLGAITVVDRLEGAKEVLHAVGIHYYPILNKNEILNA